MTKHRVENDRRNFLLTIAGGIAVPIAGDDPHRYCMSRRASSDRLISTPLSSADWRWAMRRSNRVFAVIVLMSVPTFIPAAPNNDTKLCGSAIKHG